MNPVRGLGVLTATKTVGNVAMRWVGVFLPVLARAFGASTSTLTGVMGVSELGGLLTSVTGRLNDRGHERKVFAGGLLLVAVSSAFGLIGSVWAFGVCYSLMVIGVAHTTMAGHAWIGHRVPFDRRARAIGLFEASWALSLLLGAPILAGLIALFGWRGPYVLLMIASLAASALVMLRVPRTGHHQVANTGPSPRLPRSAWPPMLTSSIAAQAGIGFFVIAGTWLADDHGMGTTALGVIAACYGGVELVSSLTVASATDRLGPRRAVAAGLATMGVALGMLAVGGSATAIAIAGLIVLLGGFEYAFVSSLTLVTEAAPASRGKAIGVASALSTIARASGVAVAGLLYERFGIAGPLAFSAAGSAAAALMLSFTHTPRPESGA